MTFHPGAPHLVAQRLQQAEGLVWLDSSMDGPGKVSLITA